jgi:Asp-tRNA(Asn)/Glu-tRNA(Gln) amidotransferase A subunit family amidase
VAGFVGERLAQFVAASHCERRHIAPVALHCRDSNFTGQATITLSGGFDKRGAPIGFQLVGKHMSESLLLRAGHAYRPVHRLACAAADPGLG